MSKKPAPKAPDPDAMVRRNYFMPPALTDGLQRIAECKGGTAAEHLRKAVHSYVKRHDTHV